MELFSQAAKISKRFKISAYGGPGTGKTLFGLSFPKVAVIDMERGTDWYAGNVVVPELGIDPNFMVKHTKSATVVKDIVRKLADVLDKNPGYIETLVIDPITLVWDNIQEAFMARLRKKKGEDAKVQFQHWKEIKAPYRELMTDLLNLPVHIVLLGREAAMYEQTKGELIHIGTKIATEKDTPYIADIHLRFFTRPHPEQGHDVFFAEVEKDRTHLLKKGSIVKDCCYKTLAALAEKRSLGQAGESVTYDNDAETLKNDETIFDEDKGTNDNVPEDVMTEMLGNDKIEAVRKELGWAPGKVKAVANKHGFTTVPDLGKFLADEVRKSRSQKE